MNRPTGPLLLDLDGTLVDSVTALRGVYHSFLLAHGRRGTDEDFTRHVGPPLETIVARLKQDHLLEEELDVLLADYKSRVKNAYAEHVDLSPGARELLRWSAVHSWPTAVVTSAPRDLVKPLLSRLGVPSVLVAGDDVKSGKPAPDPYLEACRLLGIHPTAAVAVEDSPSGVLSSVSAGVRCIAVAQGRSVDTLRQSGAWLVERDLHDVVRALDCYLAGRGRLTQGNRLEIATLGKVTRPSELHHRISQRWERALMERPGLYDGSLFAVARWAKSGGGIRVELLEDSYRAFMAQRSGVEMGLWTIGVTGLVVSRGHLLVGRRSSVVTQYPGVWEPVPSGGYEPSSGTDPVQQLHRELYEELGLHAEAISTIGFVGLFEDLAERVVDLVYRVNVRSDVLERELVAKRSAEHDELRLVRVDQVTSLDKIVPCLVPFVDCALSSAVQL